MLFPVPCRKLNSETQDRFDYAARKRRPCWIAARSTNLDLAPYAEVAFIYPCHRDSPRGYIGMLELHSMSNKHTLAFSLILALTRTHIYLTTMKFATTSSVILLAFSLFQLAYTLPVPAPLHDAPYKRTTDESASHDGEVPYYLCDRTGC
jgi:hypothetical protein